MFTGAFTAMVTPFRDGKLDEARLIEQIEHQIAQGIDGLVPVGSTGESPTLSFAEHERVIELTVQTARGRVPVIAGTGANNTAEALELHAYARQAGATACLSVNPYYNKPTQEGLYRHFMTLADKVDLPIVLYNIPGRCGITMAPATVARLSAHKNIVAIKESTGSIEMASEIRDACDITILSGDDYMTVPLMALGARGVVSVSSNLIPSAMKKLVKTCLDGDFRSACEQHKRLFKLFRVLFLDGNPAGIKYALSVAGRDTGELRLPLVQASESTQQAIRQAMQTIGQLP
jgi:4-hydroxy-tetrahydrodipicolinate synthase